MFNKNSMRKFLSLLDVMDSYRVTMDTSVDEVFCTYTAQGIILCGRTKDRAHAVNGCESKSVSRSEWESVFEKEGDVKENKACLSN